MQAVLGFRVSFRTDLFRSTVNHEYHQVLPVRNHDRCTSYLWRIGLVSRRNTV